MGGSHKIDVVAAPFCKLDHHGSYLFWLNFHPFFPVADIIVLAKDTEQIARTDEDGARTISSDKR